MSNNKLLHEKKKLCVFIEIATYIVATLWKKKLSWLKKIKKLRSKSEKVKLKGIWNLM